jgi:hypothetical protein
VLVQPRDPNDLERELAVLVGAYAPQLLALKGYATLIAAKPIGELGSVTRLRTDAQLARLAGIGRSTRRPGSSAAIASTGTATASSTARCTRSQSSKGAGSHAPGRTSRAS